MKRREYSLEGTSYCPDSLDYQLLDEAVEEFENTIRGPHLSESISDIILEIMARRLADKGLPGKLDDSLCVVVTEFEEEE